MNKNILAGVDEAGYGPKLGPLIVSSALFVKDKESQTSLNKPLLPESINRRAGREESRVRVDDSKKIYQGASGFYQLEKTALSFWYAMVGELPRSLGQWLWEEEPNDLALCPWFGTDPLSLTLPRQVAPALIEACGNRLRREMKETGINRFALHQRLIFAPSLNRDVARFGLKSASLYRAVSSLIQAARAQEEGAALHLDVDKLGGRNHYLPLLEPLFPLATIRVEEEGQARSSYTISEPEAAARIAFHRRGDAQHSHVALASILSKYLRELFMGLFNGFWQERLEGLRPTAGYPQDAARFLREIEPHLQATGLAARSFIRAR